ncbi:MAG: hypothetical protein R2783_08420 [Gelidibacter sp.]
MKLNKIKSIDELHEKDLLQLLLSNQLNILRRIDFLEDLIKTKSGIKNSTVQTYDQAVSDMISNLSSGLERINEHLAQDDMDKGELKL